MCDICKNDNLIKYEINAIEKKNVCMTGMLIFQVYGSMKMYAYNFLPL